ncbi:diacylglycerol kinase [Aquamicrobium sp. LC103]|uniref:diacylglycerol kinase n=1 Tax=Aquamicrobium sp. LC103 TaxID=1120658 RepID=UPI00063EB4B4|nr:diacylglycerol kinase [Aquamicrobium sp. LC103]TKT76845.1 diacylglycerol kinase [Aquamicrobium sp. LC103]
MQRLIKAACNSLRALNFLLRNEEAFRLEAILFVLALPVAYVISPTWRGYGLLMAALLLLMIVEVLNTAVEAACNALSREFNADIQIAKDCGSLAVAIATVLAVGIWGLAIWERLAGAPI